MTDNLEQKVLAKAQSWLDGDYDADTKAQVKSLMDSDMKELTESFYKDLEFGTGGLRGIMGVGSNRMNIYCKLFEEELCGRAGACRSCS